MEQLHGAFLLLLLLLLSKNHTCS